MTAIRASAALPVGVPALALESAHVISGRIATGSTTFSTTPARSTMATHLCSCRLTAWADFAKVMRWRPVGVRRFL